MTTMAMLVMQMMVTVNFSIGLVIKQNLCQKNFTVPSTTKQRQTAQSDGRQHSLYNYGQGRRRRTDGWGHKSKANRRQKHPTVFRTPLSSLRCIILLFKSKKRKKEEEEKKEITNNADSPPLTSVLSELVAYIIVFLSPVVHSSTSYQINDMK